jgi:hypothetical protein
LRAFSDNAMTPRRCCRSSTARCPPNPTAGRQFAGRLSVTSVRGITANKRCLKTTSRWM